MMLCSNRIGRALASIASYLNQVVADKRRNDFPVFWEPARNGYKVVFYDGAYFFFGSGLFPFFGVEEKKLLTNQIFFLDRKMENPLNHIGVPDDKIEDPLSLLDYLDRYLRDARIREMHLSEEYDSEENGIDEEDQGRELR